ncbi:hypothetical protein BU14_0134s0003 [Porphyra umbilicalis]|uniref:Uncharacterized protein n=1 Tax=Porphyra umbilicalis TaxID=2786 RepID=A0A1X6PA65_PORUM|nr:hypothetical protein BU14_0134s0003 [Porphyra umbilicalis]|eukprot:OSX77781.1 hypothetical protein BU14_0134s0003 [Porphyra umbilicalis]
MAGADDRGGAGWRQRGGRLRGVGAARAARAPLAGGVRGGVSAAARGLRPSRPALVGWGTPACARTADAHRPRRGEHGTATLAVVSAAPPAAAAFDGPRPPAVAAAGGAARRLGLPPPCGQSTRVGTAGGGRPPARPPPAARRPRGGASGGAGATPLEPSVPEEPPRRAGGGGDGRRRHAGGGGCRAVGATAGRFPTVPPLRGGRGAADGRRCHGHDRRDSAASAGTAAVRGSEEGSLGWQLGNDSPRRFRWLFCILGACVVGWNPVAPF